MYILDMEPERFEELYDMVRNDYEYYEDEFLRLVEIPTEARNENEWEWVVLRYEYFGELNEALFNARERKDVSNGQG